MSGPIKPTTRVNNRAPRDTNPSTYQEVFVTELRARRDIAGLSRNKVAAALGCTPQWLAKVETFEKPPSEGLADDLDTYFQTGGMFRRLWEKHVEARKPLGVRAGPGRPVGVGRVLRGCCPSVMWQVG
jgi:hypothetical protein